MEKVCSSIFRNQFTAQCLFCPWIQNRQQFQLRKRMITKDHYNWTFNPPVPNDVVSVPMPLVTYCTVTKRTALPSSTPLAKQPPIQSPPLKYIGGVDISFGRKDPDDAVACLVVCSFPDMQVVYVAHKQIRMTLPYIAGFLAFREVQPFVDLIEDLRTDSKNLHLLPQLIMVDGNGVLHMRKFGLACHLGVMVDIPTIGCAKKMLYSYGITELMHQKCIDKLLKRNDYQFLYDQKTGAKVAAIMKTTESQYDEPLYVSPGHRTSVETCVSLVQKCCITMNRLPEPVFKADQLSRQLIKKHNL